MDKENRKNFFLVQRKRYICGFLHILKQFIRVSYIR